MTCAEHDAARDIVARALADDLGGGADVTTEALISPEATGRARVVARAQGVVAGTLAAEEAFRQVDAALTVVWRSTDGERITGGEEVADIEGGLRSILTAERTALNLLGHLSGVATLTRAYADAAGDAVTILDTRKTTPGLRVLEKAAVRAGGGANHRMGLYDAVLIKDNHLAYLGIDEAVKRARQHAPSVLVEVECDALEQVAQAVRSGADRVLLDNMPPEQVREAVEMVGGRLQVEVSGGVTLDNVAAYAAAGPDFISVGALTHSAPGLDVSLEIS